MGNYGKVQLGYCKNILLTQEKWNEKDYLGEVKFAMFWHFYLNCSFALKDLLWLKDFTMNIGIENIKPTK